MTIAPPPGSKPPRKRKAYYPTGDGKPVAETPLHRDQLFYACSALALHFANRPEVYVSGNDFLYYEEGNPKARVSPDCYVAIGVEQKQGRTFYKIWEENDVAPAVVFEFTSKATRNEDMDEKRPLYEQRMRVQEYFQFDPTGDYLKPRLQGQRLQEGQYEPIPLMDGRMVSEELGLELVIQGSTLRFYDPIQQEWLLAYADSQAARLAAAQAAARERQHAEAEAQRAENETRRAEAATRRAENETRRAEAEAQRAEAAERELAQLRAEMKALRQ